VNSVNGPRGFSTSKGKKKERTEAQRRASRPTTMGEQLGDHQQWAYAATGAPVPQSMARGQRSWAALVGAAVFWLSKLADEFGRMMINRRFWPTNFVKRMRVIPQQFYACRRVPIHVDFGSNGHGRWRVCGPCAMRVACQDIEPDKSTRAPAARASAGAAPPWPASADAQAAGTPYQQVESEQPDVIMHDVEEQAKKQRAQRRRQAAPSPAKRAAMEPSASSGDGNDETMRLLQQIANKQHQQEASIDQLCATVSGQMESAATLQSKAQQLSAHSSTAQVLTGCGTPSAAAAATQEGGWGFVGAAPVVSAYPSYGAGPATHRTSNAAWPPPFGCAKTRVGSPRGLRDQQGALISCSTISSFAMLQAPGGTQQQPPATAPVVSAQQLTWVQSGPMQAFSGATFASQGRPVDADGEPGGAAWRQQQQMRDAEKKRLAKEGWEQTGWKTWGREGGG
ncbi:unnamed protein product, partial [Prorocentrum cordatum]